MKFAFLFSVEHSQLQSFWGTSAPVKTTAFIEHRTTVTFLFWSKVFKKRVSFTPTFTGFSFVPYADGNAPDAIKFSPDGVVSFVNLPEQEYEWNDTDIKQAFMDGAASTLESKPWEVYESSVAADKYLDGLKSTN